MKTTYLNSMSNTFTANQDKVYIILQGKLNSSKIVVESETTHTNTRIHSFDVNEI